MILSLANNNPIESANEATFKANVAEYNSELAINLTNKYLQDNSFDSATFDAGVWDGTGDGTGTIKEYITGIKTSDAKNFEIQSSKLVYVGTDNLEEQWVLELGITYGIIQFNGSVFSEEALFYQYCLKTLKYKTDSENDIDTDGYFGPQSQSVLNKFMLAEGFTEFTSAARNKLVELAKNEPYEEYITGFIASQNKLEHFSFVYSCLYKINNHDDPFYSINVLKNLPYIVTSEPSTLSYSSKMVADTIKNTTKLFGYVNLGPNNPGDPEISWVMSDLNAIKDSINNLAEAGWYGVFIDQFGYDWHETRARQNEIVDYAHSKGLKVMANSWFPADTFLAIVSEEHNPDGIATHLNSNDFYLIESFYVDGSNYRASTSYIDKYIQAMQYHNINGIKITTLSYKFDTKNWLEASEDVRTSYILAECLNYSGWWFDDGENSDNLGYGNDPIVDLGTFTQYLTYDSGTKYIARTTLYTIEYNADPVPTINLIPNP
ncbi:MAG: hypothetical protein PHD15_03195 [Clostridia bacterium]|nr:hypothetical protein [Clostridia bacterium]MDD4386747.1 hypothetical protein [Clostridia bacterium]